jgi:hypothetical protein
MQEISGLYKPERLYTEPQSSLELEDIKKELHNISKELHNLNCILRRKQ